MKKRVIAVLLAAMMVVPTGYQGYLRQSMRQSLWQQKKAK